MTHDVTVIKAQPPIALDQRGKKSHRFDGRNIQRSHLVTRLVVEADTIHRQGRGGAHTFGSAGAVQVGQWNRPAQQATAHDEFAAGQVVADGEGCKDQQDRHEGANEKQREGRQIVDLGHSGNGKTHGRCVEPEYGQHEQQYGDEVDFGTEVTHASKIVVTHKGGNMAGKRRAAILNNNPDRCLEVYGHGRIEQLAGVTDLVSGVITGEQLAARSGELEGVEAVFSTWGLPPLGPDELARLPSLKVVFYAAGSVRSFAPQLLQRGIRVMSSWAANAVPVAEFSLAQVLLSCKGYWRNVQDFSAPEARGNAFRGDGNFGATVGLIGAGMVGRALIELLRPFQLRVIVHDPFLPDDDATSLGVEKVSLEDLFSQSYVVSNHLPNLQELRGLLDGALFERMKPDASFINTGRGAQVDEAGMIRVLQQRPDLTALLDVTYPEPPDSGSPLYRLPNVRLSTHIAGSLGDELVRMADYAIEDFGRWDRGEPLRWEVTPELLQRMA